MENSCRKISKPSTKTSKSRKKHKRHCESPNSDDSDFELLASSDGSRHRKKKHQEKKDSKRKKKRKERARDSASVHGEHAGHMSKQSTTAASTSKEAPRPVHAVTEIDMAKLKATLVAQTSKARGPMTKEEYEKQQSVVRRVYDPDTGRHRLVKGDGEIIEEIVSRDRQKAINKQATLGDGLSFQAQMKRLL